ncbi:DUF3168 domain-containing protein [Rhizobium sp.]|uniref:DUF3168 domain-containing protein n=1 Tax=Rhizobium sp. TaxID=391 RepID=UPI00289CBAE9
MSAANALLKAIHQRLSSNAGLTALIGPDGIRDRLLARPKLPAIIFGEMETRDLSTVTEAGEEHFLVLEIWSEGEGRKLAQEIAAKVTALLDDADLTLDDAVLVSLLRIGTRSRREPKTRYYFGEVRFRAVTE